MVQHPLAILSVCLIVLTALAAAGARTKSNYNQLADLDPDRPSVIGAGVVRRYFAVGELSPAAALIDNPGMDFRSPAGTNRDRGDQPAAGAIENVAEVRSLTQPVGKPLSADATTSLFARLAEPFLRAGAESRYVSLSPSRRADRNHITRFDIVFKTDPFSEASLEALEHVREVLQAPRRPVSRWRGPGRSAWSGPPRRSTTCGA